MKKRMIGVILVAAFCAVAIGGYMVYHLASLPTFTIGTDCSAQYGGNNPYQPFIDRISVSEHFHNPDYTPVKNAPLFLPVHQNSRHVSVDTYEDFRLEKQELERRLHKALTALNLSTEDMEYTYLRGGAWNPIQDTDFVKDVREIKATGQGITIRVQGDGDLEVQFDPPVPLPEGCSLKSKDRLVKRNTTHTLIQQYKNLLGYASPGTTPRFVQYEWWTGRAYDQKGGIGDQLLSYAYRYSMFFSAGETDALGRICVFDRLSGNPKLGSYPTISARQAKRLLLEGKYMCYLKSQYRGVTFTQEDIKGVEVIYDGESDKVYMPYYCFWVQAPHPENPGETCYESYYVPAIERRYIEDFDKWMNHTQKEN